MAKIMLVEDDTNLSEIYQARLIAEGYEIVSAHDGEEALALAAKEKPDLIISDVMMPKISGFEMLDILRNTEGLKETKVIMLTALGQADDKTRAQGLGADRYLVKSQVTLEDIVKAAQELVAGAASAPAAPPAAAPVAAPAPAPVPTPVATPVAVAPAPPVATPVAPVAPAPQPAPAPAPAPVTDPATADNKLVADAVEDLIEDASGKTPTNQQPTPAATPDGTVQQTDAATTQDTDDAKPHKKVIKPIRDGSESERPSLESLLADEERQNAGAAPMPVGQPANTPVTNVPHQPGHIITPSAAESMSSGNGIDPNSIAL